MESSDGLHGYYDVEAILASEEAVPVTFKTDGYRLGYLDPNETSLDIKAGAKVDLPFWMAKLLKTRGFVSIGLPAILDKRVRRSLRAKAEIVNLATKSPYYFELGAMVAEEVPGGSELKEVLNSAFIARNIDIVRRSQNERKTDVSGTLRRLTTVEQHLFGLAHAASTNYDRWKSRKGLGISESSLKRKARTRRSSFQTRQASH